ncbi:MAG: TraB domain-containing protein [Candidatus Aenigmarchaeota archaeon]|nr:TraB domain-containing protein [Candidatus Aenigmarchaeota archaeon]
MDEREVNKGSIIFVPTSHIAGESVNHVKEAIAKERPDCVAVELDAGRYHALSVQHTKNTLETVRLLGVSTFALFWIMKKLQDYLGSRTGILPGSDMLAGVETAKANGITVALIDQPIGATFYKIKKLPVAEKMKLLKLLFLAVIGIAAPLGKKEKIDLDRLPPGKLIKEAMTFLENELPGFYRILVSERNAVMAANLQELACRFPKTVCVIGAAHESGIKSLLR